MKKRNDSLRKAGMLIFLILVVIGFSVPLFLNPTTPNTPKVVEPRVCQHDADCYLTCGSDAVPAFCFQNLCLQNSCDESTSIPYQKDSQRITMTLTINTLKIPLAAQTSSQDLFVQFEGDSVKLFSNHLSLVQILEKAGITAKFPCITSLGTSYCVKEGHKLQFLVNGIESYQYESYLPKAGDVIRIEYS